MSAPTNPSPGDYNYDLASTVPGWSNILNGPNFSNLIGGFVGTLQGLILDTFAYAAPNGANPLLNITSNDGFNTLDVIFQANISDPDVTTLTALVGRMADTFIITTDGGHTDLGDPAVITLTAGPASSATITLQVLAGDGTARTGVSDAVSLTPSALMPISTISGSTSSQTGRFAFTIGASLQKGAVSIQVQVDAMPIKTINASWA